jgi:hypothetical protein
MACISFTLGSFYGRSMPVMDLGESSEVVIGLLHEQLAATADKGETLAWFICPGLP